MQTAMRDRRRPWWGSRWLMPALSLTLGGLVLGAMALGGNLG